MRFRYWPILILFMLCIAQSVFAATYYVAKTGGGTTCSQASPCLTINAAITKPVAGDTIIVHAGTYVERISRTFTNNGTSWANTITLKAADGETVIWKTPIAESDSDEGPLNPYSMSYWIIDGFRFEGTNSNYAAIKLDIGSHHVRVQNCIFIGWHLGISAGGQTTAPNYHGFHEILNNTFQDMGYSPTTYWGAGGLAIYVQNWDIIVDGNSFINMAGGGMQVYNGTTVSVGNATITNNYFENIGELRPIAVTAIDTAILAGGANNLIANNIINRSAYAGIRVQYSNTPTNTKILNNTIYDVYSNGGSGVVGGIYLTGNSHTVQNNIVYSSSPAIANNSTGSTVSNNLTTNPSFVNISADNFRLLEGSTAIDAGVTRAEVTDDYDEVARPQGSAYDIGAFEYVVQVGDTTPPTDPSNLVATTQSSSQINLTWTASTDASGILQYRVERCEGLGCSNWTQIATPATNSYNDTDLVYNTLYRYQVRAEDNNNLLSENYSNIDEATTSTVNIASFLVAHWAFEGDATDETGNHNASNVGTPTYTEGRVGQALTLNGTSSALSVPHNAALSIAGDMTLSFWVYLNSLPASTERMKIIHKETLAVTDAPYSIDIHNTGTNAYVAAYWHTDGQSYTSDFTFTNHIAQLGTWVHAVLVRDVSAKKLYAYLDGNLEHTVTWTNDNPAANTANIGIGYNSVFSTQWLDGKIDELRIYSMALKETDALSLYTSVVSVLGPPTGLSTPNSGTPVLLSPPSALSTPNAGTPVLLSPPSALSTPNVGTPAILGPPTNLGTP